MAKEYEFRGSIRTTKYRKVNGRFKKVSSKVSTDDILNKAHWKKWKRSDESFGARVSLSGYKAYTSTGVGMLLNKYTTISPDGNEKVVYETVSGTAKRTDVYKEY